MRLSSEFGNHFVWPSISVLNRNRARQHRDLLLDWLTQLLELCNIAEFLLLRGASEHFPASIFFHQKSYFLSSSFRVDRKNAKNEINKEMSNVGNDAKNFLDRFLGDVSKKSATKQILIGAGSGW
jgi:hypothetical protein